MRKRRHVTPWEACGQTREEYEAWERAEFRAALVASGIDPDLTGVPLVDAMEAAGMVTPAEAAAARPAFAALAEGGGS